jgi:F-type H+-transporting ATPase subunit beta
MSQNIGKIVQVIGPVVDISFETEGAELPKIYDALEVVRDGNTNLVIECQQHIGENTIRAIAMDSTDGLKRGMDVIATGSPIRMPKGEAALGRLLNVTGDAVDGLELLPKTGSISTANRLNMRT